MSMTEGWTSNCTVEDVATWLRSRERVVILTHAKPDGDALGSSLALRRALVRIGIEAQTWYEPPLPRWAKELGSEEELRLIEGDDWAGQFGSTLPEPDGVIIVDTGSWAQVERASGFLRGRAAITTVVDHHISGSPDIAERLCLETTAAAVCQTVARLCGLLLGCKVSMLPVEIASMCYMGVGTDTGWFRHSNVDADVLRIAADLLEAGTVPATLFRVIEQQDRPARLRLMAKALSRFEMACDERLAIQIVREGDFAEAHADPTESGGFVDLPMSIASVEVSAVLTEVHSENGPRTKVSMRSKAGENAVDVAAIAGSLGGGGHARAAGARIDAPVEEVRQRIIEAMP